MIWDGKMYDKYRIAHTDGTPLKGKKYFVLRLDSEDPVEAARVEAAMLAYKGEVKTSASNAAAMREALDAALVLLEERQKLALCRNGFVQIKTKYCDLKDAIEKCRAALAKPLRNYDRFATEKDAQIAFLNEVWLIGVCNLDRDPFDGWTNEMKSAYSKWIFANATENEGDAK